MKCSRKSDEEFQGNDCNLQSNLFKTLFGRFEHLMLTGVVEAEYTTQEGAG
jgi:hypothetical protein